MLIYWICSLEGLMMTRHKNTVCNRLLCLIEIFTLYELDKQIGMTDVKLK